jgi:hypothetical protein
MRVDYFKAVVITDQDVFVDRYLEEWYQAFGPEDEGSKKRWSLRSLGAQSDGKRAYALEIWGEPAASFKKLNWHHWHKWLARMDYQWEFSNVNGDTIDRLYHLMRQKGVTHNLTRYSSRPRTKRGGQHTGGEGLAVGSHRSDFRFSAYRKPHAPLKIEVQIGGNRLRRMVDQTAEQVELLGQEYERYWDTLERKLALSGYGFCERHVMDWYSMLDFIYMTKKG